MFSPENYQYSTAEACLEYCRTKKVLGLDTETTGLDFTIERVIMIQIGDEANQYVIDTRYTDPRFLSEILLNRDIVKVLANAKFDILMLRSSFDMEIENVFDVQLAERILNTGRKGISYSLAEIQLRRLNIPMSKESRLEFTTIGNLPFTEKQIVYGAKDIETLPIIAREQWNQCNDLGLLPVLDLENEAVLAFADIEYNGLKLNPEAWLVLYRQAKIEQAEIEDELDEIILSDPRFSEFLVTSFQTDMFVEDENIRKVDVKWSAPKQVVQVLRVLVPGLEGVNAKVDLAPHKGKFKLMDKYIKYKEYSKKVTSYGEGFIEKNVKQDGKIHTSFFQILETGRVSSSGPNMQQIPADNRYRNCFVPSEPGWVFVSSDYSSQELCIIASGSNDPVWVKALEQGKDLHSVCAAIIFGDKWTNAAEDDCAYMKTEVKCDCKEHKKLRTFVKTINFG